MISSEVSLCVSVSVFMGKFPEKNSTMKNFQVFGFQFFIVEFKMKRKEKNSMMTCDINDDDDDWKRKEKKSDQKQKQKMKLREKTKMKKKLHKKILLLKMKELHILKN